MLSEAKYFKNVLTIMTGTSVAQAIPIIISPILTRIYTPEDFGLFALYMSLYSVLGVVATGRYELAIILPRRGEEAYQLAVIAATISCLISAILLVLVALFQDQIASLVNNESIAGWLYLIPLSVLVSGLYQVFNYWFNRNGLYRSIAINRVLQTFSTAAGQLSISFVFQSIGLIIGQLIGQSISLVSYIRKFLKQDYGNHTFDLVLAKKLLYRHSQFPKIDVPTAFMNVAASQAPNFLLASLFSANSAGFFYLTQRVLQAPITLIAGSFLDVFKQRASEDYKRDGHCRDIFKKTFVMLFLLSVPTSTILYFWIKDIFILVFGPEWEDAGEYAKILIPALSLRFMANPLSFVIYIAEKQRINLVGMLVLMLLILTSLLVPSTALGAVYGISFSYCFVYFFYLIISARFAKVL